MLRSGGRPQALSLPEAKRETSLLRQALASNLLLVGLAGVALIVSYAHTQRAALNQQLRLRGETLSDFLATESRFDMLVLNHEALEQLARNALAVEDVLFVEVREASGRLVVQLSRDNLSAGDIPAPP